MKQEFTLNPVQSKLFIQYFNAAMRNPETGFLVANGSAKLLKDGKYESKQAVSFEYKSKKIFVAWEIILNPDNSLYSIGNTNIIDDGGDYELMLSGFISDILQRTLNQARSIFFERVIFKVIAGCNLPGEYWLPGFRLGPLFPDDDSFVVNAERLLVIDQNVKAIDSIHAREVAQEEASKFSAYISFILDKGLYRPIHQELYFLVNDENRLRMERKSTQVIDPNPITEMPQKKELCQQATFEGSVYDLIRPSTKALICPSETKKIIKGIESSDKEIRDAFLNCCLLYQQGLNIIGHYPTVRLAYAVAAVDAIVKTNTKKYISFTDFMMKYGGASRKLCDLLFSKVRSAHWHTGKYILGDFDFNTDFLDMNKHVTFDIILDSRRKIRTAILKWLDESIGFTKID